MRRTPLVLLGLLGFLGLLCAPVGLRDLRAEERGMLGEDWEQLILEGVVRQERSLKDAASIDTWVGDYQRLADRPSSGSARVARLYLLARAHGKRLDPARRDLAEAQSAYQDALKLQPRCYFALRDLAMLALAANPSDPRTAEARLQQALAIVPNYVQALRDLARLCQNQGRHADAVVHFRRVIDLEPSDRLARAYYANSLLKLGRAAEARREVDALLRAHPREPVFRSLMAHVELAAGRPDAAIALWRQLQRELPSSSEPSYGLLEAYRVKQKQGEAVDVREVTQVLNALLLMERDAEKRRQLEDLRGSLSVAPSDPREPPNDAALMRALAAPDENVRAQALAYVAYRREHPTVELLKAVFARLGPQAEPSAVVRANALVVLGRHGGLGTVRVARLSLYDAELDVRQAALGALLLLGSQSPEAARVVLAVLGGWVASPDAQLAAAARLVVLRLAQGDLDPLGEGLEENEEQRAERWRAWWVSPMGVDLKVRALGTYTQAQDHHADQVLAPYLDDPDFFVAQAAYAALAEMKTYVPAGPRARWAQAIPVFVPGEFTPQNRAEKLRSVRDWLGMKPE